MKKFILSLILSVFALLLSAQTGGLNTYDFLRLPFSARVSGLGGNNVSHYDNDLSFTLYNPALLRPIMDEKLFINYNKYVGDINLASASFAKNFKDIGTFSLSTQYLNYGNFTHTNEVGNVLGRFSSSECAFNLSYSRAMSKKINVGASLKSINSFMQEYTSYGIAFDFGGSYIDTAKNLSIGAVVKNLGFQLKTYTKNNQEALPLDFQVGMTKKFKHAPIRISITAHNLFNWNLKYKNKFAATNQQIDNNKDEVKVDDESKFRKGLDKTYKALDGVGYAVDEFARHLILGIEIVPHDNFYISLGYNHRRRMELSLISARKISGMSVGFGLNLRKFNFAYSFASYHVAANSHNISVGLNLNQLYRKN